MLNLRDAKIVFGLLIIIGLVWLYQFQSSKADTIGRLQSNDLKYVYIYSLTGTAPYVRFVNKQVGAVYDATDLTDYLNSSPTWTDTDVSLTDATSTIGGWQLDIPSNLPDGVYDLLVYDVSVAEGSRSSSDAISRGFHIIVQNNRIVQMSQI